MVSGDSPPDRIRLWDRKTGRERLTIDARPVAFAFSPDGAQLACARGYEIHLLDTTTYQTRALCKGHSNHVQSIAFSRNGKTLVSGGADGTVRLWEPTTGKPRTLLAQGSLPVFALCWGADDRFIAVSRWDHSGNAVVSLLDAGAGTEAITLPGAGQTCNVALSPDGKTLATRSSKRMHDVGLWEAPTGKQQASLPAGHEVMFVAFSPDGTKLASCGFPGEVRVWEVSTKRELFTLKAMDCYTLAFSADSRMLLTGGMYTGAVRSWESATGKEVQALTGPVGRVGSLAFTSDDRQLASLSLDGVVRIWDVARAKEIQRFDNASDSFTGRLKLAITPDGQRVSFTGASPRKASGESNLVCIGAVDNGKIMSTWDCRQYQRGFYASAFSTEGRRALTGDQDGAILVWDVETGRVLRTLLPDNRQADSPYHVHSVELSPDGSHALSTHGILGNQNWLVRLWDVDSAKELRRFSLSGPSWNLLSFAKPVDK